tara:strand:- start:20994 stop:22163 length:1170 start_codon:yes stop_codon:yes gene_type:complete
MFYRFFKKNIINFFLLIMEKRYKYFKSKNSIIIKGKTSNILNYLKRIFYFFQRPQKSYDLNLFHEKNVLLLPPYGLPITRRGKIVLAPAHTGARKIFIRTLRYLGLKNFLKYYVSFFFKVNYENTEKNILFLIPRHGYSYDSPNYCHWLTENLPQLRILEILDSSTKVILNEKLKKFQIETLSSLEAIIPKKRILNFKMKPILVENLYFGSIEDKVPNHLSIKNIQNSDPYSRVWLRNTILEGLNISLENKESTNERLFIVRDPKERRQILNFRNLIPLLEKYKFELYQPGVNGFKNDILKFNNAQIVMGLNGAGLANVMFMKSGHLIELIPKFKSHDFWFRTLSQDFGDVNYHRIELDHTSEYGNEDLKIDIDNLELKINSLFENLFN